MVPQSFASLGQDTSLQNGIEERPSLPTKPYANAGALSIAIVGGIALLALGFGLLEAFVIRLLEIVAVLGTQKNAGRRPLRLASSAELLLGGHVDVGNLCVLAHDGHMGDHIDGRDVASDDAHAVMRATEGEGNNLGKG